MTKKFDQVNNLPPYFEEYLGQRFDAVFKKLDDFQNTLTQLKDEVTKVVNTTDVLKDRARANADNIRLLKIGLSVVAVLLVSHLSGKLVVPIEKLLGF